MKTLLLTLVLAAASFGADATGKWTGTFEFESGDGEIRTQPAVLIFEQSGGKLTGSGGPDEQERYPIRNGRVENDRLLFEIATDNRTMVFDFKLDGDSIVGEAKMERDGETRVAKFKLTRVKS